MILMIHHILFHFIFKGNKNKCILLWRAGNAKLHKQQTLWDCIAAIVLSLCFYFILLFLFVVIVIGAFAGAAAAAAVSVGHETMRSKILQSLHNNQFVCQFNFLFFVRSMANNWVDRRVRVQCIVFRLVDLLLFSSFYSFESFVRSNRSVYNEHEKWWYKMIKCQIIVSPNRHHRHSIVINSSVLQNRS